MLNIANMIQVFVICFIMTFCGSLAWAQAGDDGDRPFLHPLFADNMVFQREMKSPIWGWTTPGAVVTVRMNGKSASAIADTSGKWRVKLGKLHAGGPYELKVHGPQQVTLKNVMVGDVWLCSGQSNMEMGISAADNADKEIATANYPNIRLLTVKQVLSLTPLDTIEGRWDECTPKTVVSQGTWAGFFAAGYFFGRGLHTDLNVPIGLIQSSWGSTFIETWTSVQALEKLPEMQSALNHMPKNVVEHNVNIPAMLYNAMIAPLGQFAIKGVIWYQGEKNADHPEAYRTLLPTLIGDWRSQFDEGKFPFLIVQLANLWDSNSKPTEYGWPELREAQALTTGKVRKTGLAVAIDIGDPEEIHAKNKQEVGRRLELAALAIAYKQKTEYSGPVYKSTKVEGTAIRIRFTHVGGGLIAKGGDHLTGFIICGEDKKFVLADAAIDGDTVVVSSPDVKKPMAVRYAWKNNPICNLYNRAGLPAGPFRTDSPQ